MATHACSHTAFAPAASPDGFCAHSASQRSAHAKAQPRSANGATEQSAPRHPPAHAHVPAAVQLPRREQPLRQPISQPSPLKPARHAHLPAVQSPCPEQPCGQVARSHARPDHPDAHMHLPRRHIPRPAASPQSSTHACTEQSTPENPS